MRIIPIHWRQIPPRPLDLPMRQFPPQPNQPPRRKEDNQYNGQDNKTIRSDFTAVLAVVTRIQERVCIPALGVVGQVCKGQVQQKNQNEECQIDQRVGGRGGQEDF